MSKKLCLLMLKYMPCCGVLVMVIHVALLLFGYDDPFTELICGSSIVGCALFLMASYALEFCLLHRLCIMYTFIVSACIDFQRRVGFAEYLTLARWITLLIGSALLIQVIRKWILGPKSA